MCARKQRHTSKASPGHCSSSAGATCRSRSGVRSQTAALPLVRLQCLGPGQGGKAVQTSQTTLPARSPESCEPRHHPQASRQILPSASAWRPLHAPAPAPTTLRQRPGNVLRGCACTGSRRILRKQEPCSAAPWSGLCPAEAAQRAAALVPRLCSTSLGTKAVDTTTTLPASWERGCTLRKFQAHFQQALACPSPLHI